MLFPKAKELTTADVKVFPSSAFFKEAMREMISSKHRHILVCEKNRYYDLSVHHMLCDTLLNNNLEKKLYELDLQPLPAIHKEANILDTLHFLQNSNELVVVLDDNDHFFGIVTRTDIISSIDPSILIENITLKHFLDDNKRSLWVSPDTITKDIVINMSKYEYNAVIIVEDREAIGIFTTKDILELFKNDADMSLSIKNYMVHPVQKLDEETSIKKALDFMKRNNYKQIITVDKQGKISGDITQKRLISLTYTKWVGSVKKYQQELAQINGVLEQKSKLLEKRAETDYLTGLYNRMKFMELYLAQYKLSKEKGDKLSIIIIDIDHFKKINDTFGHNVGDKVLKQLSNVLLQTLRQTDIVCRWGGEEFLVLLPLKNINQAIKVAEQIRSNVENFKLDNLPHVTISLGMTEVKDSEDFEMTLDRADEALYRAKKQGRNCVVVN